MKGEKKTKTIMNRSSELWDNFKWINMLLTGVHDGEEKWGK